MRNCASWPERGVVCRRLLRAVPEPLGPRPTSADVVAHIEHALKAWRRGSCALHRHRRRHDARSSRLWRASRRRPLARQHADRVAKGIAAAGERADSYPFKSIDLRGPRPVPASSTACWPQRGDKPARIEKVLGKNVVRYARDIWGALSLKHRPILDQGDPSPMTFRAPVRDLAFALSTVGHDALIARAYPDLDADNRSRGSESGGRFRHRRPGYY